MQEMQAQSLDVLFDDRAERPGVKFKDADLIGVPYRVTIGKRKFEQGLAEIFQRSTKQIQDVKLEAIVSSFAGNAKEITERGPACTGETMRLSESGRITFKAILSLAFLAAVIFAAVKIHSCLRRQLPTATTTSRTRHPSG